MENIDKQINVEVANNEVWTKSLKFMPTFTIKEIEKHRLASGKKRGIAISKTLERGRKFKEERYEVEVCYLYRVTTSEPRL